MQDQTGKQKLEAGLRSHKIRVSEEEAELTNRFRVALRYLVGERERLSPPELNQAIDITVEEFVRLAREHARRVAESLRHGR